MRNRGRIKVLDKDTLGWYAPNTWWRNCGREDSIVLDEGDSRELFYIKSYETAESAAIRLAKMTGWMYEK